MSLWYDMQRYIISHALFSPLGLETKGSTYGFQLRLWEKINLWTVRALVGVYISLKTERKAPKKTIGRGRKVGGRWTVHPYTHTHTYTHSNMLNFQKKTENLDRLKVSGDARAVYKASAIMIMWRVIWISDCKIILKWARLPWRQPCFAGHKWVLRSVEREGDGYLTTTLVINCCGVSRSFLTASKSAVNNWGGCHTCEKSGFFSCTRIAAQCGSIRKINGIHQLDCDLSKPAGSIGSSLLTPIVIALGRALLTTQWVWKARDSLTSVFIKCICSVILNARLRLCHLSPCSFNMMDLFGKSFRW